MYRASEIISSFATLLGWRQPTKTGVPTLTAANTQADSGRYYDAFHKYVNAENLWETQPDESISTANFNTWLTNFSNDGVMSLIDKVFSEKKDVLENIILYPFENRFTDTLDNDGDFVGFEIDIAKTKELSIQINKIITGFDAAGDTVKVLLLHSSQNSPITTKEITTQENSSLQTVVTDFILSYSNSTYVGGKFYIGYLTSGLTAKAINRRYENSNEETLAYAFNAKPMRVSGWNSETMFDVDDIEYTADTYGLNFDISSRYDYTDFIIQNKLSFVNGIGLQSASDTLEMIYSTVRSNRIEEVLKDRAKVELEGNVGNPNWPEVVGIYKKLQDEVDRINGSLFPKPLIEIHTGR